MKCPECGNEMEKGVISAPGLGMVWSEKPIYLQLSGEPIPSQIGFFARQYLDGHRCKACRLITAHYPKELTQDLW